MLKENITLPAGFSAAGIASGLKQDKKDLALIYCDRPAVTAGVFTTNLVKGDSLVLTKERVAVNHAAQAIVINAGNANACTGLQGYKDAQTMAREAGRALSIDPELVLVGSTGVIGQPLDLPPLKDAIHRAAKKLATGPQAGHEANQAMLTTDLTTKEIGVNFPLGYGRASIGGMAKGSGMIHPNMATMIAILTTDARITADALQKALNDAVYYSFNRVSVDGDTSCCDMVLIMSSGRAEHPLITDLNTSEGQAFSKNLAHVCRSLSRMIAADGEGASKLVDICVNGATDGEAAYKAALAVAKSPLVKTAIFGEDANWGRILNAVGYSGAQFDPTRTDIYIGELQVCKDGMGLDFDEKEAKKILQRKEVTVTIELNSGYASDHFWTCDFTHDYIKINADYRS